MSAHGALWLTDAELLAILLRHGKKNCSALELAHQLLGSCGGLAGIGSCDAPTLTAHAALGHVQSLTIAAAFELARRWQRAPLPDTLVVQTSQDAYRQYHALLRARDREYFVAVALDARHRVIREQWLASGDRASAPVTPRHLFALALSCHAAALLVLHNHPGGDPTPSQADACVTHQLAETGRLLELPLLDHVIIGHDNYFSFRDAGILK